MDFMGSLEACYDRIPPEIGAGYYEMFGRSVFLPRKAEFVDSVMKRNVAHYLWGGIGAASTAFFGDKVLFVVEGDEWKRLRKIMTPELKSRIDVPKYVKDMTDSAVGLSTRLNAASGSVDLITAIGAFHLSSTSRAMYNVNPGCVEAFPAENEISKAFNFFLGELPRRSFDPDPAVAQDYTTDNEANRAMWAASGVVHKAMTAVVRDRLAGKNNQRQDMLKEMLNSYKQEFGAEASPAMVESALGANMIELLFAGYNTVVNSIAIALREITVNDRVRVEVLREVDQVLRGGTITAEHLDKLPYLDKVFKEVLRLYPPAPVLARRLEKDQQLGKFLVPKDAEVMMAVWKLQRDPQYWKDPEEFRPERWSVAPVPGSFVPFSDGARGCMGRHFARIEFLVAMATLLQRSTFAPDPEYAFGMVFNGFGWQASDLRVPYSRSLKLRVQARPGAVLRSLSARPASWMKVAAVALVAVLALRLLQRR